MSALMWFCAYVAVVLSRDKDMALESVCNDAKFVADQVCVDYYRKFG